MNSLSIPQKYISDTLEYLKEIFPLSCDMFGKNDYGTETENEFVIDENTGEIVGIIFWERNDGTNPFVVINSFEVNKNYRGKGLGTTILQEFMKDKEKIFLHYKDEKAKKFYVKNGFREIVNVPKYVYYKQEK